MPIPLRRNGLTCLQLALIALSFMSCHAAAQNPDVPYTTADGIVVSAQFGEAFFDSERRLDDDRFRGLSVRYHLSERWALEGWMGLAGSSRAVDENTLRAVAVQFHPAPHWRLNPSFGLGYAQMHYRDPISLATANRNAVMVSHGWSYFINRRVSVGVDARLLYDQRHSATDAVVSAALQLHFGSRPARPRQVFYDSDGDGIADVDDYCPDTPAGAETDATGCRIAIAVAPLPEQAPALSQEPAPAQQKLVQRFVLESVNFPFNSAQLTPRASAALDSLVAELADDDYNYVQIEGHTDIVGDRDYNRRLAAARAAAVQQYLATHGIEAVFESAGYGELWPRRSSASELGRGDNRRVEIKVWQFDRDKLQDIRDFESDLPATGTPALILRSSFLLAEFSPASRDALARLAADPQARQRQWLLLGYSDLPQADEYGQWLARARAMAVRSQLMVLGVPATNIRVGTSGVAQQASTGAGYRRSVAVFLQ